MKPHHEPVHHLAPDAAAGFRFAIVSSRFHESITENLVMAAIRTLMQQGCHQDDIPRYLVPGAFEIPFLAKKLADTGRYHAIVCLGCVIRGETPHFDYICQWIAHGVGQVGLTTGVPASFGVITADTLEQAIARSSDDAHNKGVEAAVAALEMAQISRNLKPDR